MDALLGSLAQIVGPAGVLSGHADIAPFVTDCRGRYSGDAACVVRPRSTDEVAAVVAQCVARSVPIQAQGGNTSLCGGSVPRPGERFTGGRSPGMNGPKIPGQVRHASVIPVGIFPSRFQRLQCVNEGGTSGKGKNFPRGTFSARHAIRARRKFFLL